jgi:hypothetical protein
MAALKYIKSATEIPIREKYVLIQFGSARKTVRHSRGLIIILPDVNPDVEQDDYVAAVAEAQRIADEDGVSTVYVIDRRAQGRTTSAQ